MKNSLFYFSVFTAFFLIACSEEETVNNEAETKLPEISNPDVENAITASYTTIEISGNVKAPAGTEISEFGVVWANEPNPTLEDNVVPYNEGERSMNSSTKQSTQDFTITISDLKPNKEYFIRIFATNQNGTKYGDEFSHSTLKFEGTKWKFKFDHNGTNSWVANVEFFEDGTAFYSEPDNPGMYDYDGTWVLDGSTLTYDMVPDLENAYILTGEVSGNKMDGTYTFHNEEGSYLWQATEIE
tara:strand:+ start:282 stop:1007 length:726 start_codon:yes stop_codon:yes gene_type:complete